MVFSCTATGGEVSIGTGGGVSIGTGGGVSIGTGRFIVSVDVGACGASKEIQGMYDAHNTV